MEHTFGADVLRQGRDTTLLKAAAAILVANSHLEAFYPATWMAGDGLLGNSLFFFLAGYGLARSQRMRVRRFPQWFWRRITRLYPTVILVMAVFALGIGGGWKHWNATSYFTQMLWPTPFTFVWWVMPFYLLFYPLLKTGRRRAFIWGMVAAALGYVAVYIPDALATPSTDTLRLSTRPLLIHGIGCLLAMMLGGYLGWRPDAARDRSSWRTGAALAAVAVAYVLAKLFMVKGHGAIAYPLLHALTFAFCLLAFEFLSARAVVEGVRRHSYLWRPAAFAGALTLEIYVVHSFIAQYRWVSGTGFPSNVLLFWGLTLPLSWLTWKLVSAVQGWLRGSEASGAPAPVAVSSVPLSAPPSERT